MRESERDFQRWVLELAATARWESYHTHDSRRSRAGWPDLALWRPGEFLLAELKTETGAVSAEQQRTLLSLRKAGVEVHLWRPLDRPVIEERLLRRRIHVVQS